MIHFGRFSIIIDVLMFINYRNLGNDSQSHRAMGREQWCSGKIRGA
jgi:hypothetical protein